MMISVEAAQRLVLANVPPGRIGEVPFSSGLGRVLAADLAATCNVPPFNRSAMDGYALRSEDVALAPVTLIIAGTIKAGGGDPGSLCPGQAKAIMTGAPLPEGADAVQIVEQTQRSEDGRLVLIRTPAKRGENVAPMGVEASVGDIILEAGRLIGPAEIAVLANFGYECVPVWIPPRVALFATGDELVEVGGNPRPDQIRNSNACSVAAQLRLLGIEPEYLGIAKDDRDNLRAFMRRGLERDVLILTGGVSMGEYDFVKEILEELGLEILFSRVAMKPGKPTVFARKGDKLVFGLPGNPVSAFIAFENFVRLAIGRLCGRKDPSLRRIRGELMRDLKQSPGRMAFLPAWVSLEEAGWKVEPLRWKGSADIIGYSRANATVIIRADQQFVAKGERIEAMLLPDFFDRQS